MANDPAVRQTIGDALIAAFPPLEELIDGALDAISSGAVAASVLGLIGVVWTVSQLYGALDVAFARIFSDAPERDIVRRTARGFLVVGIIGRRDRRRSSSSRRLATAVDLGDPTSDPVREVDRGARRLDAVPDRASRSAAS